MNTAEMNNVLLVVKLVAVFVVSVAAIIWLFRRFLFVCRPNELLIVSGKKTVLSDGAHLNFSAIGAGYHWRVPFVQTVQRMDLRLIPIELYVTRVLSNGGIPLDIHAIANVKITSDPKYVYNAVERFLNLPEESIRQSAKQTLEGVLRGVIAQLTPEQVNEDRIEFANKLLDMTLDDFNKMGLHLDTLKIQRVEDEAQYLVNIGRTQIANAVRDAENAENQAAQEIAQEEADARQQAEVAQKQAEIGIAQRRNQLRTYVGQLEGQAQSVEREAKVAAVQARAEAEQELQSVRQALETKRLQIEVVLPAEAQRKAAVLLADGSVAARREQALAAAEVMRIVGQALASAGPQGREMFVLSQLDLLVGQAADRLNAISVEEVNLVDAGDGRALSALAASYPAAVAAVLGTLKDLGGIDIAGILAGSPSAAGGAR